VRLSLAIHGWYFMIILDKDDHEPTEADDPVPTSGDPPLVAPVVEPVPLIAGLGFMDEARRRAGRGSRTRPGSEDPGHPQTGR
jgi:hypothetical protein